MWSFSTEASIERVLKTDCDAGKRGIELRGERCRVLISQRKASAGMDLTSGLEVVPGKACKGSISDHWPLRSDPGPGPVVVAAAFISLWI